MGGRLVWLSGYLSHDEWAAEYSGLAPDVELVDLEDEIGASLSVSVSVSVSVSDEPAEERRARAADSAHVLDDGRCCHSGPYRPEHRSARLRE